MGDFRWQTLEKLDSFRKFGTSWHQPSRLQQLKLQRRRNMSKADIVDKIAKDAGISKAASEKAVNAFIEAVTNSLKKGQTVTLIGFGTFSVGKRAARVGRNPKTGATIKIKAKKIARFRPGSALKNAVNK
ncbi:MAG: HU family DNA-binding protein [Candidatus Thermochlorobacter sp.]